MKTEFKAALLLLAFVLNLGCSRADERGYRILSYDAPTGRFVLAHNGLTIAANCIGKRMAHDSPLLYPQACNQLALLVGKSVELTEGTVYLQATMADLTYPIKVSGTPSTIPGTDHFAEEYLQVVSRTAVK